MERVHVTVTTIATGGFENRCDTVFRGGGGIARHSCDTSKTAGICRDIVYATLCSAIGVTAHVCH